MLTWRQLCCRHMGNKVGNGDNETQGFPTSALEPRVTSAPSTISLPQKGKHAKVKGRLFGRTKVIKIKSVSSAAREPLEGDGAFPSRSPLLFPCPFGAEGSPRPGARSLLPADNSGGPGRGQVPPHARSDSPSETPPSPRLSPTAEHRDPARSL